MYSTDIHSAMEDFKTARRKAVLENLAAQLTGRSVRMLEYDKVRSQLRGLETARSELRDIPLDSIVGTVGRYNDFTRKLLPLNSADRYRWARVRRAVESPEGVPPIDVYQIGSAYFILDGHHRASIARELGATHIQAHVREVTTRVPITPEDDADDIIIKSEYTDFLNKTHFDTLFPDVDLTVTVPGAYEQLFEHIQAHRYFMGLDYKRNIGEQEAIQHWFEHVYSPVTAIIRDRHLLRDFPGRSEADLYLWIMENRAQLEAEMGAKVSTARAAADIADRIGKSGFSRWFKLLLGRGALQTRRMLNWLPQPLQEKPADMLDPQWQSGLFESILVAVTGDDSGWKAVEHAALIARQENSYLTGLHVLTDSKETNSDGLEEQFLSRANLPASQTRFLSVRGTVTEVLYTHAIYQDLVVLRLSHPPPSVWQARMGSGLRTLIRSLEIPLLAVPANAATSQQNIVLGFGGGNKAEQALYLAAYLTSRWNSRLTVVTVERRNANALDLKNTAEKYLDSRNIRNVTFVIEKGKTPAEAIIQNAAGIHADLIITGGYEGGYFQELLFGSSVDRILQRTSCSVLVCN